MRRLAARVLVLSATSLSVAACSKGAAPAVTADAVASAPDVVAGAPDAAAASVDTAPAVADSAPAASVDTMAAAGDSAATADAAANVPAGDAASAAAADVGVAVAAAVPVARAVPPIGAYASAEDAVVVYIEGTRKQDPAMLWSVMTEGARKVLDQVIVKAKAAPAAELAKLELTPAMLVDMTPRAFFDHMVRHAPHMDAAELAQPLQDIVTTPAKGADGSERAKVTFKLGKSSCEADTAKDAEGWKVEVSRCNGP